ncbi:MAG: hypothetical protein CMJ39_06765 [Phycisphaerae bacterium]|nr:hypothetical protein [Phycisphaerae bacterium]
MGRDTDLLDGFAILLHMNTTPNTNDSNHPHQDSLGRNVYSGGRWAKVIGFSLLFGFGSSLVLRTDESGVMFSVLVGTGMSLIAMIYFIVKKGNSKINNSA